MENNYKNIYLFFVAILLLVPIGFKSYFTKLINSENIEYVLHFHTILMTSWCLILIVQPILIIKNKRSIHKLLGRLSFVIFPIITISIFFVMFYSFNRMSSVLTEEDNLSQIFLPTSQLFLFVLFYVLAIINVKKPHIHMRYIIVSSIALFGPTIGRIDFGIEEVNADLWFMSFCVLSFLIYEKFKKGIYKPFLLGFVTFVVIHIANVSFTYSIIWQNVAKIIFIKT